MWAEKAFLWWPCERELALSFQQACVRTQIPLTKEKEDAIPPTGFGRD